MRKLASEKLGSEDVRVRNTFPGWWPGGADGGGKPPRGLEVRKKERK